MPQSVNKSLIGLVYLQKLIPILMPLFAILSGLDPYNILFRDYMPQYLQDRIEIRIVLLTFQFISSYIASSITSRTFAFMGPFVVVSLYICNELIAQIGYKMLKKRQVFTGLRWFNRAHLLFNSCSVSLDTMVLFLMSCSFMTSVISNFCVVKLFHVMTIYVYVFIPFISATYLFLIHTTFPLAIQIYKSSTKILDDLKRSQMHRRYYGGRYLTKKLRAMRPLTLYAGFNDYRMFRLQNSTKSTFYNSILLYTINSIISVPFEVLV